MDASIWTRMPEDLLERILARLPFKSLFQTRLLSKSWEAKMCSKSFQTEISQVSSSWDSYCPVYVGKEGLVGYNATSKRCERLLSLSYLPCTQAAPGIPNTRGSISGCGSLLCFVVLNHLPNIYVTNVVSKTWRILPPRPNMNYPAIMHLYLVGSLSYKVILITPLATPCAQIYDSATNSWSIKFSESAPEASHPRQWTAAPHDRGALYYRAWHSANNAWTDSIYFQDTLYVLWGYQNDGPCELLAYNVDEGAWSIIKNTVPSIQQLHVSPDMLVFTAVSRILVCGERVMIVSGMVVPTVADNRKSNLLVVCELLPETQEIREVSRGAPLVLPRTSFNEAAGDDNCIYFYARNSPTSSVVVYSILEQSWTVLPPVFDTQVFHEAFKNKNEPKFFCQNANFSFQPGLNTFAAV